MPLSSVSFVSPIPSVYSGPLLSRRLISPCRLFPVLYFMMAVLVPVGGPVFCTLPHLLVLFFSFFFFFTFNHGCVCSSHLSVPLSFFVLLVVSPVSLLSLVCMYGTYRSLIPDKMYAIVTSTRVQVV
ncbi:hypothetical protein P170DRAFT_266469 [Aspergillus steynii IBT 23096]|uniref:Uncharacterized protein n=1 Tax=Aspergillus steynii IBT 23096 TaxID=1392250 RepID=A0A2I2FVT3_9EURO|nr:uncharacterized protein P170DRAFT_266469 [Aspergillus steynii IBT 23096]PLB44753.1 hypothetical protein P170DRAFT_266469 [Aspergillus steynii IBT 23096]